MRGFSAAKKHHDDNKNAFMPMFVLKKDGDSAEVRVLQAPDEWESIFVHSQFKVIQSTRCPSDGAKDEALCPLCAANVPRKLRTFIPVRVRGDEENKVRMIEYGANHLAEVISVMEELPTVTDITQFDFKVKRVGDDLDTKYRWFVQSETKHNLTEQERALVLPDLAAAYPVLTGAALAARGNVHGSNDVTPIGGEPAPPRARF
ncbi:MAG: hypothetical protein ACREQ5_04450 [Candidatus Dormibacteria bacterium]